MTAGFAANYLTGTMVCFFIGRFTGTGSSVASHHTKSLAAYALIAMALCLISAFAGGHVGLIAPDFMQRLYVDSVPNNLLAGH